MYIYGYIWVQMGTDRCMRGQMGTCGDMRVLFTIMGQAVACFDTSERGVCVNEWSGTFLGLFSPSSYPFIPIQCQIIDVLC